MLHSSFINLGLCPLRNALRMLRALSAYKSVKMISLLYNSGINRDTLKGSRIREYISLPSSYHWPVFSSVSDNTMEVMREITL